MQQFQAIFCLLILVLCIMTVQGSAELQHGTWDVSTLVPGRGAVPPNYELVVQPRVWTVRERESSRFGRFLDGVTARVGLVYDSVPSDEYALCHMPPSFSFRLAAVRVDDDIQLECHTAWFSPSTLRRFEKDGLLHRHFDSAEPLYSAENESCVKTPWRVRDLYLTKVQENILLFTGILLDDASGTEELCSVHLQARRRPTLTKSSSGSAYAPIAMLLVVVAVRLLPRYILTRRGHLDKTSYRGKNPANLTPAHRLHLLRQQKEIIEKMKEEDRANGARFTTT
ncbi:hypothetical protein JKF63_00014 [Porcisia hertigi]|uniref:Uncharacterized protein n=1 Tax=Porcisia hertigi TaxID=2761500 RepID=A0A836GXG9_9TRYP|nr:hypothetical protein JKF63_00014 [Porcisia hertigi]